jgi:hypothetical protein
LVYLSDLPRARCNPVGSRWRRVDAGRQALLVLAHLRNGDTKTRHATTIIAAIRVLQTIEESTSEVGNAH